MLTPAPAKRLGCEAQREWSGRDERGTAPLEPLLIQSGEEGFFVQAERRERDDGDAQAPHGGAFPGDGDTPSDVTRAFLEQVDQLPGGQSAKAGWPPVSRESDQGPRRIGQDAP